MRTVYTLHTHGLPRAQTNAPNHNPSLFSSSPEASPSAIAHDTGLHSECCTKNAVCTLHTTCHVMADYDHAIPVPPERRPQYQRGFGTKNYEKKKSRVPLEVRGSGLEPGSRRNWPKQTTCGDRRRQCHREKKEQVCQPCLDLHMNTPLQRMRLPVVAGVVVAGVAVLREVEEVSHTTAHPHQ